MSTMYSPEVASVQRRASLGMMSDRGDVQQHINSKNEPYVEGNLKICHIIECAENMSVMCVRFSPDGSHVAVGQKDGTIRIYRADNGQTLFALSPDETKKRLPVTSLRFWDSEGKGSNILMATYAGGSIKFWHYTSGNCLQTINEKRQVLSSAFNGSYQSFVTCGETPQLNVYDVETKKKKCTLEPSDSRDVMNGHRGRVFSVQYHPHSSHLLVSGGWDDTVQFWDDRQEHAIRSFYGPHICGDAIDIDPRNDHIVTGSWRKEHVLQIWDFKSGQLIKAVPHDPLHQSLLYCAQWLGEDSLVCGGSSGNMARVIDRGTVNTIGQLVKLKDGVIAIDNDRQSKPRIAAASSNKVYVMKMEKRQ